MPHLASGLDPEQANMIWDYEDQLQVTNLRSVYYSYDVEGQRVRKVHEHAGALVEERIYLGNFEVCRKRSEHGLSPTLERETLHLLDDEQRIAIIETRTHGTDRGPRQLIRYQYTNHLGSTCLELDGKAKIVSYEEYYPYGATSYQAVRSTTETPKRYRYTSMERDEGTGLSYHTARYYAPWLGRWTSADPAGLVGGPNPYSYVKNRPTSTRDESGMFNPEEELEIAMPSHYHINHLL